MKWSKMLVINMPNIVAICIVLHNLYIVNNDEFEEDWICEAKKKLLKRMVQKGIP